MSHLSASEAFSVCWESTIHKFSFNITIYLSFSLFLYLHCHLEAL